MMKRCRLCGLWSNNTKRLVNWFVICWRHY